MKNNDKKNTSLSPRIVKLWRSLRRRIKSDEHAVDLIYKEKFESKQIICPCGSCHFSHKSGARTCVCDECGTEIWFTSNSFFDRVKLLRAYLAAIWFQQNDAEIRPSQFAKLLRISYSTAWEILHKVSLVLVSNLPSQAQQAPCKVFVEIFLRRSLETVKYTHPSADTPAETAEENSSEQRTSEESSNESPQSHEVPTEDLTDSEAEVYSWLTDKPVSIDVLNAKGRMPIGSLISTLVMLELKSLVASFPNGYYARASAKPKAPASTQRSSGMSTVIINQITAFIRAHHHGVSRKYVQLFLARIWCAVDKERWGNNAILRACLAHPRITRADILAYASPINLKILPLTG